MGLSSAVLFIFFSLLIQSRANQEVKDIKLEYPAIELNPSPFPGQSEDFLLCGRVKVSGISRLKLGKFFSAFRVTVVPSVVIPERLHSKILVCFHRNNSLGLCHCKKDEWMAIQKGLWSFVMSPYEDRYVDVKFIDAVKGSVSVALDEDFQQWRIFFLALGFVLLLLAPIVSSWVPFYYTSSMAVGVFLVILIILFQGMKLLPTGRKNFLYLTIYGSVNCPTLFLKWQGHMGNVAYKVYDKKIKNPKLDFESSSFLLFGVGSFLLHHFSILVNSILLHFGMSEEMYNLVLVFLLVGIFLSGAAMSFWIVRKFIISEDGSVDVGVAQFVKWAMCIIGTTSFLQCTIDTPLALGAVVACWTLCSLIHYLKSGGVSLMVLSKRTRAEFLSRLSAQRRRMLGSSNNRLAWSDSPLQVNAGMNRSSSGMQNQQEYYSTFHKSRNRKKFTKQEWDDFTKESTRKALAKWAASPEFTDWIIEHADRIQLLPSDSSGEVMASESDSTEENAGRRAVGFKCLTGGTTRRERTRYR